MGVRGVDLKVHWMMHIHQYNTYSKVVNSTHRRNREAHSVQLLQLTNGECDCSLGWHPYIFITSNLERERRVMNSRLPWDKKTTRLHRQATIRLTFYTKTHTYHNKI